jgi:hypothetical protein
MDSFLEDDAFVAVRDACCLKPALPLNDEC